MISGPRQSFGTARSAHGGSLPRLAQRVGRELVRDYPHWSKGICLLTNEILSCQDRAVVCMSRGMPDGKGLRSGLRPRAVKDVAP
jgi:hypothetical protein